MSQKTDLKINQYGERTIEAQIINQIRSTPYQTSYSFFECDGDEYMFYKTFRKNPKGGAGLPVFKTYQIVYDIFNTDDTESFYNPPFKFILIK